MSLRESPVTIHLGRQGICVLAIASCAVALCAFAWALAVCVSGGFVLAIGGLRISSHRIVPPYLVALLFLLLPARSRAVVQRLAATRVSPRVLTALASCLAVLTVVAGILFGAFTAAGDAFGYIAQSSLWLKGQLFQSQGPVLAMMWPDAAFAFCPLGFRPAAIAGAMVPRYAAGLPLLMAALRSVLGETGAYLVVPLCGGVTVYLTFRLGRIWRDHTTGLLAAALLATSPVFLFQLVQPMSDVPVTAWWLLAIVAACDASWKGAFGSGLAASVAILIRPNLAPLGAPLAAWVFLWPALASLRGRAARFLLFAAGVTPLCLLVAWVQSTLYGSPLSSGYGRASDIYALANLLPNLSRYPVWLLQTHTPFLLLAFLAPFARRAASPDSTRQGVFAWLALAFAVSVFAGYAFYIPFDHWSFLRFLLPALPLLITLSAGTLISLLRGWRTWGRTAIAFACLLLALLYVQAAVRGDVFALRVAFKERFRDVGQFVSEHAPRNAAFIGLVQTSNISYYGHRQTLRYDLIPPASFDHAVAGLRSAGYKPYLALMAEEERDFRQRFAGKSRVGDLHCQPCSTFRRGEVRIYDVDECETDGAIRNRTLSPPTLPPSARWP